MSKVLLSVRVEEDIINFLRKEKVNISEVVRQSLIAKHSDQKLKEFKESVKEASESAKKLSNTTKTVREFRETR